MDGTTRRARLARSRLYLVLEARPHGRDAAPLLEAALRGGVDVVQLRDKDLRDDDLVAAAKPFREACAGHGALFVLNDRPGLVHACGADGVHVGQGDVPLAEARRAVGPDRLVGLSATTPDELDGDPDYWGVGAIHGTPTKPESAPGGLELVREARDRLRAPWFAIGGIDAETIAAVVAAGAPGVAVVRAIRDAADPEAAARALREQLPPTTAVVTGPETHERAVLPQVEILEATLAAGATGAKAHVHAAHADCFHVLVGELELLLGDHSVRVPAGSTVAAPALLVHGFRNPGREECRYLNVHAPGIWWRGRRAGLDAAEFDTFPAARGSEGSRGSIAGPGDGERLARPYRLALAKLRLPELDLFEYTVRADYEGAGEHVHLRHADVFYVLEGVLEVAADGEAYRLGPGWCAAIPPGVPHAFALASPAARFLDVHAPGFAFAEYLRALDSGADAEPAQHDVFEL